MSDTDRSEKEEPPTEAEIVARRDNGLKRMLRTPPKPHSEIAGKAKGKPTKKEKSR